MGNFVAAFQRARELNRQVKEREEKRKRAEAAKAAKRAARAAAGNGGSAKEAAGSSKSRDNEDIFGNYNRTLKRGNAADILNEFKNRQNKGAAGGIGGAVQSELAAALKSRRRGGRKSGA